MLRRLFLAVALVALASPVLAGPLPAVTASDRVLGRADAPVTVVEYASFVCPHCADWHLEVLPAFKARFIDTGQVRLVFRDLPTDPAQVSMPAAAVARCAAHERYFDVARAFMQGQATLRSGGQVGPWFDAAVAVSGRTEAEIQACLADPATRTNLNAQIEGARQAGVTGTPAFFVDGTAVTDITLDGLSAAITPRLP